MATRAKPKPSGADPVKVDAKHYSVEFENEKVRVLRIKYGLGEKSVMHRHPPLVGVFLTDSKVRLTYLDGKKEEMTAKAGQVLPKIFLLLTSLVLGSAIAHAQDNLRPLSVDVSTSDGEIRSLQGVSGPPLPVFPGLPTLTTQYRSLGIDVVRTHDMYGPSDIDSHFCPGGCPNFPRAVIPPQDLTAANMNVIFPDWAADPEDPNSYNFGPTDRFIKAIMDLPAEVFFRVGRSQTALSEPPVNNPADPSSLDFDKYANIVKHVVMHYVNGWDDGFINAVHYWEIWNEPGLGNLFWSGTAEQYYTFYKKIARTIKSVDPELQVGGPTEANNYAAGSYREAFVSFCASNDLPLDFFSWHWYPLLTNDPLDYVTLSTDLRKILNSYGFVNTRLVLSEWGSSIAFPLSGLDLAAYIDTSLIYMQGSPIDQAMYYRADAAGGLFHTDGTYTPGARALEAMGLMSSTPERLVASGGDQNGLAVIAGRSRNRNTVQILISNYAGQFAGVPATAVLVTDSFGDQYEELPVQVGPLNVGTFDFTATRTITHTDNAGYDLTINNLRPGRFMITRYQITEDGTGNSDLALIDRSEATGGTVRLTHSLPPPGVELIVVQRGQ
jgi:xylan 1,4-beta-xylosidase